MNSGGSTPQQVVQSQSATKDPWSGAVPYYNSMFGAAEGMRNTGTGYQPFEGQTVAGFNPQMGEALGAIYGQSQPESLGGGPPGVQAAQGLGQSLIGTRGIDPTTMQPHLSNIWDIAANQIPKVSGQYQNIYNQADSAENPYLKQIMAGMEKRIGDRVNSSMSGAGRYGSGAHTDVMARSLGEAEAPVLAQDYEARQARKMAATQGMQGADTARASLYGGLVDAYGQGLGRAGQWSQMMPGLDEARFAPAQRMLGVGETYRGLDQQNIDAARQLWNQQQSYPWEQLARESAIIGGAGGLGGTTTSSVSQPQASLGRRLLGGALAGGGLGSGFGPIGAGVGALGGSLAGAFL